MEIVAAIQNRYSCRIFQRRPLALRVRQQLERYSRSIDAGPLHTPLRFELIAADEETNAALRGLGTYGFIRNPAGFIIGAAQAGAYALEDFGYRMEQIILEATRLEVNTCWLGGTFTQSSFATRIGRQEDEIIPAVAAVGYASPDSRARDLIRRQARADLRLPWENLFFQETFQQPLTPAAAGAFSLPLEMVRLAPSASNKQPWRIVLQGRRVHFYLERTPNYGKGSLLFNILRLADLQRVDIGIAMCHFELTAQEVGLQGFWRQADPALPPPTAHTEYVLTWESSAVRPPLDT